MVYGVGTTHHVKINGQFYLIRPGTYRKQPAPLFGARFTTGDPDYNNLSLWQHWVQSCWVGGFGAETWTDDAMFDEGAGIDTTQHEVMMLARDMGPTTNRDTVGNWDLDGQSTVREFVVFNDNLYCLSYGAVAATPPAVLYRYQGGTWVLVHTFTGDRVRSVCQFGDYLLFGDHGATMNKMSTSEVFTTLDKPDSVETHVPYTMRVYRGYLYVAFGNQVWRLKSDWTWDGSTAFYTAEGVNYLIESEVHLGFLYFISQNGHMLRTDGNNTFDIWQFDNNCLVESMASFDGRLFVSTVENLGGTTQGQAVLYQFTGAAITELKRWGRSGLDIGTGKMRAYGGRLYFGAPAMLGNDPQEGFGIATYDPIEDGYHMFATNQDGTTFPGGTEGNLWRVDDTIWFGGSMFCSVRGYGVFRTTFSFRDASRYLAVYDTTRAGAAPGSGNGGRITSSDFDGGTPGLEKLWNAITIHVDLHTTACSVFVEGSTDGGANWFEVGTVTKTGSTVRYRRTFILDDGAGGELNGTRFKWRLTLRTTDDSRSPFVRAVIVRYIPIPEPNWQWSFDLILSETQDLLDGVTEEYDSTELSAQQAALEDAFRAGSLVNFVDIDGTEWAAAGAPGVLISSLVQDVRAIGPSSDGPIESDYHVVLTEAVEAYEGA